MSILSENLLLEGEKGVSEGKPNVQHVLKLELAKLHKQYRVLENKRHGFAQQDGTMRTRLKRLMPVLEKDRVELNYELRNANCRAHLKKADDLAYSMKQALKIYDLYQREIGKKIKQIEEIERHVDKITDKVVKQRFKLLALHGLSKTMAQRERDLQKAEDQLYHHTCSFNLQIFENKKIRQDIVDLLMGRARFFKQHNILKRQIAQTKKKMLNIVQLAIQTYDTRDEAMLKVKALREREEKEVKQHGMEVQEFERTLHHDKKVLDFIKTKLKHRHSFEDATQRKVRLGSAKEKELDNILRQYRKSFKRILAYSQSNSISDLVDAYNEWDFENLTEFQYIIYLNNECEVLRETIQNLKTKISQTHNEVDSKEREQRTTQRQLQFSIMSTEEQLSHVEQQCVINKDRIQECMKAIAAAFILAKCEATSIMRLLGSKAGITPYNVRLCIEQLDFKITELKHERDRLQALKTNTESVAAFKPAVLSNKKVVSHGGPYFPQNIIIGGKYNVEALKDDDMKIMEQEPYYYEDMREYVYSIMIEENLIDPQQRPMSSHLRPAEEMKRKKTGVILQRVLNQYPHGRRSRHAKSKSVVSQISQEEAAKSRTESVSLSSSGSSRKSTKKSKSKTKSILELGKQIQSLLSRRESTNPYPQEVPDIEIGDPLLGQKRQTLTSTEESLQQSEGEQAGNSTNQLTVPQPRQSQRVSASSDARRSQSQEARSSNAGNADGKSS